MKMNEPFVGVIVPALNTSLHASWNFVMSHVQFGCVLSQIVVTDSVSTHFMKL